MRPMDTQHVEGFHQALQAWTDHRFLSREDLEAIAMFDMYLVNLLDYRGFAYYGHTFKQGKGMGCLVVKADRAGTPWVVFTNGRTYTSCIRIFLRRLEEDSVEWRPDRYR